MVEMWYNIRLIRGVVSVIKIENLTFPIMDSKTDIWNKSFSLTPTGKQGLIGEMESESQRCLSTSKSKN